MDGSYTSTIENDRVQQQKVNQKKHTTTIGIAGGAFILLSLCMCCCIFYNNKCQRPRRRRRRNNKLDANGDVASDGIFTDAMYRDDAEDNFDNNNNGDIDLTIVSSSYSDNVQQSHPNGTLESNMKGPPNQSAFKDDPDFRPGRNFV
ncbi:hypothetical protein FRACYDRAFT_271844 [Fragilariopsis cylindrus CCMP1102]|uniref:Uncharacterized protein n=1 Tax=Fragilariopsis cylindrus CCMP1102 TaxID=635003 RepID=A0A1E7EQB9_9STRA|nr:hypothetical protein FRACYDRAFT_271844 [Fragilariopsis cylindrus CCMP1102]|eukprot:OEU08065.1 hypothetical protein FRACYDRAFT_271844 [Fragilariopsis cylindrus CCMP1102]